MEESSVVWMAIVTTTCLFWRRVVCLCPSSCDSLSCDIHTHFWLYLPHRAESTSSGDRLVTSHAAFFLYGWVFWMFFNARVRIVIFSGTRKWNITAEFLQNLILWGISRSFLLGTPEISKMILIAAVYFVTLKLTHLPGRRKHCRYAYVWTRTNFSFKYCPSQAIDL